MGSWAVGVVSSDHTEDGRDETPAARRAQSSGWAAGTKALKQRRHDEGCPTDYTLLGYAPQVRSRTERINNACQGRVRYGPALSRACGD